MGPLHSDKCLCTRQDASLEPRARLARRLVKGLSMRPHLPSAAMTTTTQTQPHAFTILLAQYISGDVDEQQITSLCDLVESADATASERLAFARFYLDAKRENRGTLPQADEWSEIASAARA